VLGDARADVSPRGGGPSALARTDQSATIRRPAASSATRSPRPTASSSRRASVATAAGSAAGSIAGTLVTLLLSRWLTSRRSRASARSRGRVPFGRRRSPPGGDCRCSPSRESRMFIGGRPFGRLGHSPTGGSRHHPGSRLPRSGAAARDRRRIRGSGLDGGSSGRPVLTASHCSSASRRTNRRPATVRHPIWPITRRAERGSLSRYRAITSLTVRRSPPAVGLGSGIARP
jgi:hypothetical protein